MQNHSAPLQELSGIFYSSPNLNTQSKRYPQAIKAIKLSSIKLNSPLHSHLIVWVWVEQQCWEAVAPARGCGFHISCAVPLAAWHPQLFLEAVFGAASWTEPSQMDHVCLTRMNSAYVWGPALAEGEVGGAQVLAPPSSVPALGQTHTCKGKVTSANLQIPARACSRRFICIHLLYDTDFPYQWLVTSLRVDGSSWAMKSCCDSLQSPSPRISITHFQFVRPCFSMTPPGNFSSPVGLHRCVPGVSNRQAQRFFSTYIKITVKCSWD